MVSPEHGGSSSSQNVNIYVISAEWGTAESCVKLGLSDGSSFFMLISRFDTSNYREGSLLCEEDLEYLRSVDEEFRVYRKALELLARRDHSQAELRLKLLQRRFSGEQIDEACSSLIRQGLLDDHRFAAGYADSRLRRKPEGILRMEQRLRQKGISREILASVLSDVYTAEATEDAIANCALRLLRRKGPLDRDQLRRELGLLGFRAGEISAYLERSAFEI